MQAVQSFIDAINGVLWGPALLILLLGTHIYFTFRLKFVQRYLGLALKLTFTKDQTSEGDISPFGALSSALAATIGTGNIIGVTIAIAVGGPGAIIWCWLTGVFGMATKYAEAVVAVKYRVKTSDGTMLGGPMYALLNGLNMPFIATLFCVFTALATFGIGCTVQANSISGVLEKSIGAHVYVTGLVMMICGAFVIVGGVKSISKVCSLLVPIMSIFYIIGCVLLIGIHFPVLGDAIKLIIESAFTPQAAGGGFVASTVMAAARIGIMRGLYSNESGMGSAPILAAAARTRNPAHQAIISMTGTFWDTVIICPLTGIVVVCGILTAPEAFAGLKGTQMAVVAFSHLPYVGLIILNVGIVLFAFSTMLGWVYYGEKSAEFLFGKRILLPYRIAFCICIFIGATVTLDIVWGMADIMNAFMALPNILSLWLLSKVIISETNKYLSSGNIDLVSEDPIRYAHNARSEIGD